MGREGPGRAPARAPFLLVPGEDGKQAGVEGASVLGRPGDSTLHQDRQRATAHTRLSLHTVTGACMEVCGDISALRGVQAAVTPWPLTGPAPGSRLPDTCRKRWKLIWEISLQKGGA